MDIAQICRVAHEANRALQWALGEELSLPWDEATDWQQTSTRLGVERALSGATPAELHQEWMAHRLDGGWRLGAVKSEEARTHPCLVPYEELPEEQRAKDQLFAAVVGALTGNPPQGRRPRPAVGQSVHYVSYGTPGGEYTSQCRAATITQINEDGTVGLAVLNPTGAFFHERVMSDFTESQGGTWHRLETCRG